MNATLTGLRRETKQVARALGRGEAVQLTEHGQPIGTIRPEIPVLQVTEAEFLAANITDAAILLAVGDFRE